MKSGGNCNFILCRRWKINGKTCLLVKILKMNNFPLGLNDDKAWNFFHVRSEKCMLIIHENWDLASWISAKHFLERDFNVEISALFLDTWAENLFSWFSLTQKSSCFVFCSECLINPDTSRKLFYSKLWPD